MALWLDVLLAAAGAAHQVCSSVHEMCCICRRCCCLLMLIRSLYGSDHMFLLLF